MERKFTGGVTFLDHRRMATVLTEQDVYKQPGQGRSQERLKTHKRSNGRFFPRLAPGYDQPAEACAPISK